jgi:hypothetical protein
MKGFVRAVALTEDLLLGGQVSPSDPTIALIDQARRDGTKMILLSERSIVDLQRHRAGLLKHFDAVVADRQEYLLLSRAPTPDPSSGTPASVTPVPPPNPFPSPNPTSDEGPRGDVPSGHSRREALLEVLHHLDVDPHDALGVSGDTRDADLLEALEVAVVMIDPRLGDLGHAEAPGTDYLLPGPGHDGLDRVLHKVLQGQPAVSPPRHNVRVQLGDSEDRITVNIPGAHANVLLCATGSPAARMPVQLVRQWTAAGYQVVVLDLTGVLAAAQTAAGNSAARVLSPDVHAHPWQHDVTAVLDAGGPRPLIVDLSGRVWVDRSATITTVLSAVRDHRSRTGRPHWLLIDGAERVLRDPNIPPEALDLAERGHCLVVRDHARVPATIADRADVVVPCSPGCPLAPQPITSNAWLGVDG